MHTYLINWILYFVEWNAYSEDRMVTCSTDRPSLLRKLVTEMCQCLSCRNQGFYVVTVTTINEYVITTVRAIKSLSSDWELTRVENHATSVSLLKTGVQWSCPQLRLSLPLVTLFLIDGQYWRNSWIGVLQGSHLGRYAKSGPIWPIFSRPNRFTIRPNLSTV